MRQSMLDYIALQEDVDAIRHEIVFPGQEVNPS